MAKLITHCPSCADGSVHVTHLECEGCKTKFEGKFEIPRLSKLSADDLDFVERFILASGSLKEMASQMDVSYPTVRNRLNAIISQLEQSKKSAKSERNKILSALEKGTISAKDAAKQLREV